MLKPSDGPSQEWGDITPTPPTQVVDESSIACIAVACFAIACWPAPELPWADDGMTPIFVCGEWPPNTPPSGGGGGEVVPVLRGFSSGYSAGFN
jgi:hypothetical protein